MTAAKPLVLLVDDDEWLSAQYSRLLEDAGYRARTVPNALDAINAIDLHRPDVIVLDLFMPGPNGIVLLHELRSHSDLTGIPIVMCTNSARDITGTKLSAYGVMATLDKTTMHPQDVVVAVRKVLA